MMSLNFIEVMLLDNAILASAQIPFPSTCCIL